MNFKEYFRLIKEVVSYMILFLAIYLIVLYEYYTGNLADLLNISNSTAVNISHIILFVITTIFIGLVSFYLIGYKIKDKELTKAKEKYESAVNNDFNRTLKNQQNLIFKLKKNKNNQYYYTLFEGKMAEEAGRNTENMYGKTLADILPKEAVITIERELKKVFKGETSFYELELENRICYETLSPVIENGIVTEVIGSAVEITEIRKAEEQIKYLAYYDSLTGLPNRVLFKDRLELAISHAKRNNNMLSVIFFDLDRFKNINDTLGHEFGDMLLKEVAKRLKNVLREDDTVARMGGDEFTLIITDLEHENQLVHAAESIIDVLKDPITIKDKELYITISMGISTFQVDGQGYETLLKNADIAMYRAKEIGRNNFQFFTKSMNEKAVERLELESYLRKAIEKDEFKLYYQPQVDINTRKVVGFEALIRWRHPVRGMVSPAEFIPLAEENGLIIFIGEWVLKTACNQLKKWHMEGYSSLRISVNISPKQFEHQDVVEMIANAIKESGISPYYVELEITENSIMKNTERTIKILKSLKKIGVGISIDDFGTGFSSLGYLQKFSPDILKIDQSFIRNLTTEEGNAEIVTAIINMAHELRLKVIAEGVETEEQMEFLRSKNCNEAQGYLFGKPLRVEELEEFIMHKY